LAQVILSFAFIIVGFRHRRIIVVNRVGVVVIVRICRLRHFGGFVVVAVLVAIIIVVVVFVVVVDFLFWSSSATATWRDILQFLSQIRLALHGEFQFVGKIGNQL